MKLRLALQNGSSQLLDISFESRRLRVFASPRLVAGGSNWFGRLLGDIRYEGERTKFYMPLISMLLVSLALSLIFYLLRRLIY